MCPENLVLYVRMPKVVDFGNPCYWDKRHKEEGKLGFEWYCDGEGGFDALRILKRSKPSGSLLELGCGSSRFAEAAAEMGYQPVLATDISEVAIEQCKQRSGGAPPLVAYEVMDCCSTNQPDASWDILHDKGTLDAVDCAGRTIQAIFEYARILRPGGVLLLTTCRDLESRQAQLSAWFQLKEMHEIWTTGTSSPCPNAYILCLQRR